MKIFTNILITTIKIYKLTISPYLGNRCRYLPTCSEYFIDSLKTHGFMKGLIMGLKRLARCHPIKILGGGEGFDPVQKLKGKNNNGH